MSGFQQAVAAPQGKDLVARFDGGINPMRIVSIACNGPRVTGNNRLRVYIGNPATYNQIDTTNNSDNNTADYGANPRIVPPFTPLVIVWENVIPSSVPGIVNITTE